MVVVAWLMVWSLYMVVESFYGRIMDSSAPVPVDGVPLPPDIAEMVAWFLANPALRINNVPSGGGNLPLLVLGNLMALTRSALTDDHVAIAIERLALFTEDLRKSHGWAGRDNANIMFTREGRHSLNGGQSELGHILNATRHAVYASAVGSPFVNPANIERRDMSLSFIIPFYVDIQSVISNDTTRVEGVDGAPDRYVPKLNWGFDVKRFAGAIGLPEDCKHEFSNASVTFYYLGNFLETGKVTADGAVKIMRSTIDTVRPCLDGVNLVKLRDLIQSQKRAIIFDTSTPGDVVETRRVFGPDRVALLCLNPELPENFMPVPTEAAMDAGEGAIKMLAPVLRRAGESDAATRRARQLERLIESGMRTAPGAKDGSRGKARGIGRLRSRWRVNPGSRQRAPPKGVSVEAAKEVATQNKRRKLGESVVETALRVMGVHHNAL